jgi:hypothetical protein
MSTFAWQHPERWWIAALWLAFVLALLLAGYLRSSLRGWRPWAAMACKAAVGVLLALCLLDPVRVTETPKKGANDVVVLADNSASLAIAETVESKPRSEQVKAATPIFALVSERRPWVEANLKETTLAHVTVGQAVDVVLDLYPDVTWTGVVESISPATGAEFAILPPQNASGNWVKVVQRLPVKIQLQPFAGEPPLRAGITATVAIDTGRQRRLGDVAASLAGWVRGTANAADPPAVASR